MMRFKKVILSLLVSLLLLQCHSAKHRWSEGKGDDKRLKILATTAQIGDLVTEIGGARVDVWTLIRGDLDPHSYEIVKGDRERLLRAERIFYNGLGLEHGASLSTFLTHSPKAIALGEKICERAPHQILKRGALIDPHIWMDISLWKEGIDPIVEALCSADPEGCSYYRERGEALAAAMSASHRALYSQLQSIPSERRYLVTSHDAFHYFARSYLADPGELHWQDRFAAPEGLAPEGQLNPRDIQKIIDYLSEKKVAVLFPESNINRDSLRKIQSAGRELGLHLEIAPEPLYGDAMSGLRYLEMMHKNGETITKYLKKEP